MRTVMIPALPLCVTIILYLFVPCRGTVTLVDYQGKQYDSQPAMFGDSFKAGVKYHAKLQRIENDPYLCGDEISQEVREIDGRRARSEEVFSNDDEYDIVVTEDDDERAQKNGRKKDHSGETHDSDGKMVRQNGTVIPPRDGLPVALLAKRGRCNFEVKARRAQSALPQNVVKFLLVYDDVQSNTLSPMSAGNPSGISVRCLFVGLGSGFDLLQRLRMQSPESRKAGGIILLLDGQSAWRPSIYDDPHSWIFVSLSGMILFVMSVGCLLMCFQTGYIRREGNVIIFGHPNSLPLADAPLLTREQVLALPLVEYDGSEGNYSEGGFRCCVSGGADDDALAPIGVARDAVALNSRDAKRMGTELMTATEENRGNKSTKITRKECDDDETTLLHHYIRPGKSVHYENASCSVCLEEYEIGEKLRMLPCRHTFHTDCILPWLTERHSNCPLCKSNVVDNCAEVSDTGSAGTNDSEGSSEGSLSAGSDTNVDLRMGTGRQYGGENHGNDVVSRNTDSAWWPFFSRVIRRNVFRRDNRRDDSREVLVATEASSLRSPLLRGGSISDNGT